MPSRRRWSYHFYTPRSYHPAQAIVRKLDAIVCRSGVVGVQHEMEFLAERIRSGGLRQALC